MNAELMNVLQDISHTPYVAPTYTVKLTAEEMAQLLALSLQYAIANPPGTRFHDATTVSVMRKLNDAAVRS